MIRLDPVTRYVARVALELGLVEALAGGPLTPGDLARSCSLSLRGVRPVLYALASAGLLEDAPGGAFGLAAGALVFSPYAAAQPPPHWESLGEAVRTGRAALFDDHFFVAIADTLFALHQGSARAVAAELDPQAKRALDLGAGSAVWSLALAERLPDLEVVAVDHARVLEQVTARFTAHCRYELRPGSYHDVFLEEEGYDVVFLGHVLHSEGRDASVRLLQRARRALRPGGELVVAENLGSSPRSLDHTTNLFELSMLMGTDHGCIFMAKELEQLACAAAFSGVRWVSPGGRHPVLISKSRKQED